MVNEGQSAEPGSRENADEEAPGLSQTEVAAALERIRFAVRQRTAERVVSDEVAHQAGAHDVPLALRQMWEAASFREPMLSSHRPILGRLVVLFKKVGFHLFAKWYLRPILEQQEAFNRAAFLALRELYRVDAEHEEAPVVGASESAADGG